MLQNVGSISEIAAEVGCTPRVVSSWRAGKIPSDENQAKLAASYEIPRTAWRQVAEPQEPEWQEPEWMAEAINALEFHHPRAIDGLYRHLLRDHPRTLARHEAIAADERAKHPALYATCEAAELALGRALAADCGEDEYALAFLNDHPMAA